MGRRNGEFFTDVAGLEAQVLAHQEHLAGARRQCREALLQRLEERLLLERLLGPGLRRLAPVAARVEQGIEIVRRELDLRWPFPGGTAQGVDDLVLEDAGDPGTQVRATGEALLRGEGRDEGFLDCVFGCLAVTQLERGVAQEIRPERFDLRMEIGAQTLNPP